jgi:hypothetical protein
MRNLILLSASLALAACSHTKPTAAPASTPVSSPSPVATPPADADLLHNLTPEQIAQIQQAQSLREEGLRLLYAKDPRVKNPKKAFEKLLESAKLGDPEKAETILKLMFANNPSMIAVLDTYASLMAEQGTFTTAASVMQVVISLQELIESNPERIDESKKALALYKKKKKLPAGFDAKPETDQPLE